MTEVVAEDTDFESHHIEGHARAALERGASSYFKVPLISHVEGMLYTGGCREGVALPTTIRYVVSLYRWEQYKLPPGASRIEVEMYDAASMPDIDLVHALGNLVHELSQKGGTLVHCQAGLNRSGLIGATALIKGGKTPEEAIALLREKRCDIVLCNQTFENWLLTEATSALT